MSDIKSVEKRGRKKLSFKTDEEKKLHLEKVASKTNTLSKLNYYRKTFNSNEKIEKKVSELTKMISILESLKFK